MAVQRNRISNEVRECLVRSYEDPTEDYLMVADTLGVNRSTTRGILTRYIREGRVQERPRGGRNNLKVDDDIKQCLNVIVDDNCMLTLTEINRELRRRLPRKPQIHDRTAGRTLDSMRVSLKLARPLPVDRNRPDVIQSRFEYANWFSIQAWSVIDECGYNIWTARSYDRAAVGERAYKQVNGQRGRNVTIVIAVSSRAGLVHHSVQIGGMTTQRFQDFLLQTHQRLPPNDQVFFIYNNAPAHRNVNNPGGYQ